MKTFTCNIAQPGFFAGHIALFNTSARRTASHSGQFDAGFELTAFNSSLNQLKKELEGGDFGASNSEIMEALTMIMEDESFTEGVRESIINESCPAAAAIEKQANYIISALESSDNEYLRNRCEDVRGISNRLIDIIMGTNETVEVSELSALVSYEISPILLSSISSGFIGALVSDSGSPNSHSSIMAGNIGVPYLFGAGEAISQMENGQTIIVDGEKGELILDPDEATYRNALEKMKALAKEREIREQNSKKLSCRTKIMANISGPEDIPELLETSADGIGLFRTELLFLNSPAYPSEEDQFIAYSSVLEAMKGKEVIIRTMDLGSDKTASWLKLPAEINPALGLRGARISIANPDLLNTQLRALLRAATKGNLKVMFPMIISEWEVDELIKEVNNAANELRYQGIDFAMPEIGVMIETPSAVMIADRLAEKVSFFSIGTNDLTQYTLGLDREGEGLDRFFDPRHESVLRLIELTVRAAHEKGITVGICGQLAADPEVTDGLVRCGIDELSVSISKVNATRANVAEAEKLAEEAEMDADMLADETEMDTEKLAEEAEKLSKQMVETEAENLSDNPNANNLTESPIGVEPDIRVAVKVAAGIEAVDTTNVYANENTSEIAAVADGELIPMSAIPDDAFASGILGPCVGILPENGNVYAPCDGKVMSIADTKHAITIGTKDGSLYLIHMGIETVNMKENAFDVRVNVGQTINQGDLIAIADLKKIENEGYSTIIVTIRL